ncbi:unnamed protein product [Rhizophagus irregularis]|nr:unnamed protein product [Rhizophagus irregularis]
MSKWHSFDVAWSNRFLDEAEELLDSNTFAELKKKVSTEHLRYTKKLQTFWQGIIKKYEKENLLVPAETSQSNESLLPKFSETSQLTLISAETLQPDESLLPKKSVKVPKTLQLNTETLQSDTSLLPKMIINKIPLSESSQLNTPSLSNRQLKVPDKILSEVSQLDLPIKNNKLINFCYDIFHELENETYANLFYKYVEKKVKNKIIEHPMDLLTINSKLENNQYTSLEEFEKDIRLIFRNCYTYNDVGSEIYNSGEALESIFNKKWNEKLIYQDKQINDLKRTRDNNTDDTDRSWK